MKAQRSVIPPVVALRIECNRDIVVGESVLMDKNTGTPALRCKIVGFTCNTYQAKSE